MSVVIDVSGGCRDVTYKSLIQDSPGHDGVLGIETVPDPPRDK